MWYIALRMLFGDKSKCLLLICSLSFATVLIAQQTSIFVGLLRWSTALLRNSEATIWVVDKFTEQVNQTQPMRDIDLYRVRSVQGVSWAFPIIFSIMEARLENGQFQQVQLIGLDSSTFAGVPINIVEGSAWNLLQDKTVMTDQVGVEKFTIDPDKPFGVGSIFEINDREARVVALCKADRSFYGMPYIYTTYERAKEYIPPQRKLLSYIIVQPQEGYTKHEVIERIEKETGLRAFTEEGFAIATIKWFFKNTGIPISFGTTVILGFVVGIAVAGQTFYSFITENIPNFSVLRAMGATNRMLYRMMFLQAFVVGCMGYGIGMWFTGVFGQMVIKRGSPPFYMPWEVFIIAFVAILSISCFSVVLGARKIRTIEPAQVFRA